MTILDAVVLGVVQGLTEFLPISSSGHLILSREVLYINIEGGLAFDAVLQFATALAVVFYFKDDVRKLFSWAWSVFRGFTSAGFYSGPVSSLYYGIAIATLPALVVGSFLEDIMGTVFRNATLVAGALILGSAIMYAAERWGRFDPTLNGTPTRNKSFLIGLFQMLALVPGMSRSGMTIAGAMLLGLSREEAARFSFLLAIPILLGAGAKKILDLIEIGATSNDFVTLAVGALVSFAVGIAVIHYLLMFLRTHSLMPFIVYRLVLAGTVLVFSFAGGTL